ncbi:hypothetical protein [Haloarchaeobius sp. HRN-SO-5]|uniref:hypothetical protein n=1 Tax=Haloarchaeobius sp. HRN-SO-5 TaxID=3446118 RepID=UPI003EB735CD
MTHPDADANSGPESAVDAVEGGAGGRGFVSKAFGSVRRAAGSGALATVGGLVSVLSGLRSFRRGEHVRGLGRLFLGAVLLRFAATQRQSIDGEQRAETGGTPVEIEAVGSEAASEADAEAVATGEDVSATDVEEAGEADVEEAGETEPGHERLGEAAFDEHANEVPVPQHAFDREFLAPGAEAFWGVRETDDAVLVSQLYNPLDEAGDVRYVGSSDVDDDRMLSVPDVVLDHWDEVAGGGTPVTSGTELVFASSGELAERRQLLVVPEQWAGDVLGAEV